MEVTLVLTFGVMATKIGKQGFWEGSKVIF